MANQLGAIKGNLTPFLRSKPDHVEEYLDTLSFTKNTLPHKLLLNPSNIIDSSPQSSISINGKISTDTRRRIDESTTNFTKTLSPIYGMDSIKATISQSSQNRDQDNTRMEKNVTCNKQSDAFVSRLFKNEFLEAGSEGSPRSSTIASFSSPRGKPKANISSLVFREDDPSIAFSNGNMTEREGGSATLFKSISENNIFNDTPVQYKPQIGQLDENRLKSHIDFNEFVDNRQIYKPEAGIDPNRFHTSISLCDDDTANSIPFTLNSASSNFMNIDNDRFTSQISFADKIEEKNNVSCPSCSSLSLGSPLCVNCCSVDNSVNGIHSSSTTFPAMDRNAGHLKGSNLQYDDERESIKEKTISGSLKNRNDGHFKGASFAFSPSNSITDTATTTFNNHSNIIDSQSSREENGYDYYTKKHGEAGRKILESQIVFEEEREGEGGKNLKGKTNSTIKKHYQNSQIRFEETEMPTPVAIVNGNDNGVKGGSLSKIQRIPPGGISTIKL